METTELDWYAARSHFNEVQSQYFGLLGQPGVNVDFALQHVFIPLARRYEAGERTKELYDEMMSVA